MITNISEVNMYYANIDTLKFCLPESPEKAGNKPEFRHTESRSIDITFLRSDGSPFDLTGIKLNLAMDNDYLHCTSLVAFADGDNVQIVDAAKGVARFYVDCNSRKFEQLVVFGSVNVKMEIVCIQTGETTERTILHDCGIRLFPRIRTSEGAPANGSPNYYNKSQIDAMMQVNTRVELAACTGMGIKHGDDGTLLTWIDPEDVVLNGATLARWNRTVLVRKVGGYPESHEDGETIAETSRAETTKNQYRMDGFLDSTGSGTTYFYKLFSQTTAGVWNNADGNRYPESTNMSWGMIQSFIRAGKGPELWPVGTVFVVDHPEYTHNDGTGLWFRVVGHDQVQAADETLTHSMCLDMVDCLFSEPYDAGELMYALTEDKTAQVGKTYYTLDGSTYTKLIEGTDYNVGDPVPIGAWYEKNLDGRNQGSNNPIQNNMIQWANSAGAANQWFSPQTLWDICSSNLSSRNGFMRHIDPEFLKVVQPATLISALCNAEGGGRIIHSAKFWPLSKTQIDGTSNNDFLENVQLEYYVDGGNKRKLMKDSESYADWLSRSVAVSSTFYVQCFYSAGNRFFNSVANTNYGFSLACIIA